MNHSVFELRISPWSSPALFAGMHNMRNGDELKPGKRWAGGRLGRCIVEASCSCCDQEIPAANAFVSALPQVPLYWDRA